MAQTVANFADVMKDTWTADRLERQYYADVPWLDRIERTPRYTIGNEARVPVDKGLTGSETILAAAGGTLNPADEAKVDRAVFTLSYFWSQIDLQAAVLNQGDGGDHSVADAMELEVNGALTAIRRSAQRVALSNGDALIAECTTTTGSATVNLLSTGYGVHAVEMGWLRTGQTVDIGTAANEVSVAADRTINSVQESTTDPEIRISGATVTTATGDFVSISNARAGTTSNEYAGLRSIVGSTTSAVGGLDPDTAGEEFWKPASVATDTAVSLDNLLLLQRRVFSKSGKFMTFVLTSPKQLAAIYSMLQSQVRFTGDRQLGAGGVESVRWNNMEINAWPDVPDREIYFLTLEDFLIVTGQWTGPMWTSQIEGNGKGLRWVQGATGFVEGLTYPHSLAIRRRNTHAANISLTA